MGAMSLIKAVSIRNLIFCLKFKKNVKYWIFTQYPLSIVKVKMKMFQVLLTLTILSGYWEKIQYFTLF